MKHVDVRGPHSFAYVERESTDAFLAANGKEHGETTLRVERSHRHRRR